MADTPTVATEEPAEEIEAESQVADADDVLDEANDQDTPGDVEEETVELTDDDLGNGLFAGVEDGESGTEAVEGPPEGQEPDVDEDAEEDILGDGLEGNAAAMEGAINDGAARLATVGLTDDDFEDSDLTKSSLEEEFAETFQAFRLGYFGSQVVDEYVLSPEDEDVNPVWGLAGSMLIATAMVVWLRPDGDEAVAKARDAVGDLTGAVA